MKSRLLLATAAALLAFACTSADFDPQNMVQGVRILGARADKPYSKPGDSVTVDMLVADERKDKARALKVMWFPFVCANPAGDAYFACFSAAAGGAGTGGGLGALPKGVDLSPLLPQGTSYNFTVPQDVVRPHKGAAEPYGIMFLFNVACAGRLMLTEVDPSKGPQGLPLACVDESGTPLGPDDYVFGYTRLFAYNERVNANPSIDHLVFDGAVVDAASGITVAPCTEAEATNCPEHKIDVVMKPGAQELNSSEKAADGTPLKEVVWASYYTSAGRFGSDARLLFDAREGEVSGRENKYFGKSAAKTGAVWVVVKDNRGGTDWLTIPLNVR